MRLADENANRRVLTADLTFRTPMPLTSRGPALSPSEGAGGDHFWLPAAPVVPRHGPDRLREAHNPGAETIDFAGRGYHDHNWGTLPFDAGIRDWYWARVALDDDRALIAYHVDYHRAPTPVSHLLLFDGGRLVRHDPQAQVRLGRPRLNVFGTAYASRLEVQSGDLSASSFRWARVWTARPSTSVPCAKPASQLRPGGNRNGNGGILPPPPAVLPA